MTNVNWQQFEGELGDVVTELVTDLFEGGAEDLASFATEITGNTTAAIKEGKGAKLGPEIRDQWRALAEVKRLNAVAANWKAFEQAMEIALKVAVSAVGAVLV